MQPGAAAECEMRAEILAEMRVPDVDVDVDVPRAAAPPFEDLGAGAISADWMINTALSARLLVSRPAPY